MNPALISPSPADAETIPAARARPRIFFGRWALVTVAGALLLSHMGWLLGCRVASSVGPDAHDFSLVGRLLAEQRTTSMQLGSPLEFVGKQWLPAPDGREHSIHDAGFSVLLAAVRWIMGAGALAWVNPILVTLALLGFLLWCARRASPWTAVAGTAVLACAPALNQSAGYGASHPLVLFCMMWALVLGLRGAGKYFRIRAVAAGCLLGCVCAIRAADVPVAAVLGFALLLETALAGPDNWLQRTRSAACLLAGAALPVLILGMHNWACFGAPWKTAYSNFNGPPLFSQVYLRENARDMMRLLVTGQHAPLVWLGFFGGLLMLATRGLRGLAVMIAAGVALNLAVYLPFYWPVEEVNDRFFLPAFVLLVAAAVFGLHAVTLWKGRAVGAALAALMMVLGMGLGFPASQKRMAALNLRDGVLRETLELALDRIPARAVVISDYALLQEIDVQGGWKGVDLGRVIPPPQRGFTARPEKQVKAISRQTMGVDDWMRNLMRMPIEIFDRQMLPELKLLSEGGILYVLAPSREWQMLRRRWAGNWAMLGSLSLPLEDESSAQRSDAASRSAGMQHPLDPGRFYDLRLNGESIDLMRVRLW